MFCTKCGKRILDGDRFCANCGAAVRETEIHGYEDVVFNPPFKIEAKKRTEEILKYKDEEFGPQADNKPRVQAQPSYIGFVTEPVAQAKPQAAQPSQPAKKKESLKLDWDLGGFPEQSKKREDFVLDWGSVVEKKVTKSKNVDVEKLEPDFELMFKSAADPKPKEEKPEIRFDQKTFNEFEKKEERRIALEEARRTAEIPVITEEEITAVQEEEKPLSIEELEREIFGEMSNPSVSVKSGVEVENLSETLVFSKGKVDEPTIPAASGVVIRTVSNKPVDPFKLAVPEVIEAVTVEEIQPCAVSTMNVLSESVIEYEAEERRKLEEKKAIEEKRRAEAEALAFKPIEEPTRAFNLAEAIARINQDPVTEEKEAESDADEIAALNEVLELVTEETQAEVVENPVEDDGADDTIDEVLESAEALEESEDALEEAEEETLEENFNGFVPPIFTEELEEAPIEEIEEAPIEEVEIEEAEEPAEEIAEVIEEPAESVQEDLTVDDLFKDVAPVTETKREEKFYTYNQKSAAFDELLEKERLRLEEMEGEFRKATGRDPSPRQPVEKKNEKKAGTVSKKTGTMAAVTTAGIAAATTAATAKSAEQKSEEKAKTPDPKRTPVKKTGESEKKVSEEKLKTLDELFRENEEYEEKRHPILRFLLIIILIVALVEFGAAAVIHFAPETSAAQFAQKHLNIQNAIELVKSKFSSDDEEEQQQEEEPIDEPEADPNEAYMFGLIDAQSGEVSTIGSISYDANLNFDYMVNTGFEAAEDALEFEDSDWYEDAEGNTVTYGDRIVGTVITHYDTWIDTNEDVELVGINELVIGTIAAENQQFYVPCKITYATADGSSKIVCEVLNLEIEGENLVIREIKEGEI